jgi:transposase
LYLDRTGCAWRYLPTDFPPWQTMTLQIVSKRHLHAFEILPRRWVVERTFAWISKHRRTTRDYEHLPASHEAMILWAMIALMTRRLAQPA